MFRHATSLLLCVLATAAARAEIISFENGAVPSSWTVSPGVPALEVSAAHAKLGTKALVWTWAPSAVLTVADPPGLASASTAASGGLYLWIYNGKASPEGLVFSFLNSARQVKCSLEFSLNFTGWRCLDVAFSDLGHDRSSLATMTVRAPASGGGVLCFDHVEFQPAVKWDRMSDAQYSVRQSSATVDFLDARKHGDFGEVPPATAKQIAAATVIAQRLDDWYLSSDPSNPAPELAARKAAIASRITYANAHLAPDFPGNGTAVSGVGLYPDYAASTIDGVAIRKFRDVETGSMFWLALDFRLNGSADSRTRWLNLIDWFSDQGWADGSAMGGLMGEKLRSAGYFHSLFLMRNELGPARLQRELNTLGWFGLWGNVNMPSTVPGENADQIRTMAVAKLVYALLQPDADRRVAALNSLTAYFNNAFAVAPGFAETFKPDHTGYHHNGTYDVQYYPDALYSACWVAYLLHDTPFALSDATYRTLKQCLLTLRLTASLYDEPTATSGRFPLGTTYLDDILPAYAYLALAQPHPDQELLAAFSRLWRPDESPLKDTISRSGVDICLKSMLGETELCLRAEAQRVPAEGSPTVSVFLPYSGLMVHRDPDAHVTIKGFSKYVWDYEADTENNLFGRYLSYGQIEYTDLRSLRRNNAYGDADWDWCRLPGTTTKHIPPQALRYGSSTPYRNFSDRTLLGGVALDPSTAVFSLQLHDNTFDRSFSANKSVFLFGHALVCLGSDINNQDASSSTETTLFQQPVGGDETIAVNGTPATANAAGLVRPIVRDNLGNRFVVTEGTVNLTRVGDLAMAVIDHGRAPANQRYGYFMLLQSTDDEERQFSSTGTCPIVIERQDALAHVVYHRAENVRGYAIYAANTDFGDAWIQQVNVPCVAMVKQSSSGALDLVLSDPDMHRPSAGDTGHLSATAVNAASASFLCEVLLRGVFTADGGNPGVTVTPAGTATKIALTVVDGQSYAVHLRSGPSSSLRLNATAVSPTQVILSW